MFEEVWIRVANLVLRIVHEARNNRNVVKLETRGYLAPRTGTQYPSNSSYPL
jgi:hypothetical protein